MDDMAERQQLKSTYTARRARHIYRPGGTSAMASGELVERWRYLDSRITTLCALLVEESIGNDAAFTD